MSKNEVILTVDSLTKTFQKDGKDLFALDNVSFDLHKGEILGVIGRNGAGKSTLLKVLSQITSPSSGEITYEGQLTSIIDIGTGFHADLSGEENIYLSALLLGYSKKEISELYNQIVAFSGLHDFMQMPVKHYSSGMYLRLAFSIAFHAKISILLLDEVIAVGDADFKRKCYSKIQELKDRGTSIILVSHNLELVIQQSDRCILLEGGKIVAQGNPFDTVHQYHELIENNEGIKIRSAFKKQTAQANFTLLSEFPIEVDHFNIHSIELISDDKITTSSSITVRMHCSKEINRGSFEIALYLINMNGVRVLLDSYAFRSNYETKDLPKGAYSVEVIIPADLMSAGMYRIGIQICMNRIILADLESVAKFRILPSEGDLASGSGMGSVIRPKLDWKINANKVS